MDRRKFLTLAGITGVVAATTGGLGYLLAEIARNENVSDPQEALLAAIDALPDTQYRAILQEKVAPLFAHPRAATIPLVSIHIPLFGSSVVDLHTTTSNDLAGMVKLHHFESGTPPTFRSQKKSSLLMPYPYLMNQNELEQIDHDGNGIPYIQINFEKDTPIFSGVNPYIELISPPDERIAEADKEFYRLKRDFIRVKEAASLFYNIQWLTYVDMLMQNKGETPTINTYAENGSTQRTEAMTAYNLTLMRNNGRFPLFMDIAGSVFALKAYQNTDIYSKIGLTRDYGAQVLASIHAVDLGQTPAQILQSTYALILNSPNGERNIYHNSEFDYLKIP